MDARLSHDYLNFAMDREGNLARKALNHMTLRAYLPEDGEVFAIGDSPVLIVRGTVGGVSHLFNAGSQIILPIHSRCVLLYTWETSPNVPPSGTVLSGEQVRSLNKDYFHGSNSRYVFARRCDVLKEAGRPRREPKVETLFPIEKDGWPAMGPEVFRNMVLRAAKDAEDSKELDSFAYEVVRRAEIDMQRQTSMDS